jgi:hypothetical protein
MYFATLNKLPRYDFTLKEVNKKIIYRIVVWSQGIFMGPFEIIILYIAFRLKQLVCDYFLQTAWIAYGKEAPLNKGGLKPLLVHAGFHGLATLFLTMFFAPALWFLGPIDFLVHGLIDKAKAFIVLKKKWTARDTPFWWAIGIDQEAHNYTHLIYIIIIARHCGAF